MSCPVLEQELSTPPLLYVAKLILHFICSYFIEDNQKTLRNFLSWMTPGDDDTSMVFSGREIHQMKCLEINAGYG